MKRNLAVTSAAREDLEAIWFHIAQGNEPAAERFLDQFEQEIGLLALFPYRGEAAPRVGGYRRILLGSYLIFYQPSATEICILRVFHSSRRIEDIDFKQ